VYTGTQWISVKGTGGSGSADSSTFLIDTTYTRLAKVFGTDTLLLKSFLYQFNGVNATVTETDSTAVVNYVVPLIAPTDTADMLSGYVRILTFLDSVQSLKDRYNRSFDSLIVVNDSTVAIRRFDSTADTLHINSGTGGGSQSLQQVTDIGDSTNSRIVSNDTLKGQSAFIRGSLFAGDTLYSRNDSLIAFGTSITAGSGVSGIQRFPYILANQYGMIEANYGAGGATLNSIYTALYKIPTKTSNRGYLMFEYGMNDAGTLDTATFKTRYSVIIDTATARGWPANRITLVGGPFSEGSLYTYIDDYNRATRTVAEQKGVQYIDAYAFMQTRGGTALTIDSVHPTALGHVVIAQSAKTAFLGFKKRGLIDVTGDVYARGKLVGGTPYSTGQYPYDAHLTINGKAYVGGGPLIVGADTSQYENALINAWATGTSTIGFATSVKGTTNFAALYPGYVRLINSSNQGFYLYPTEAVLGNGSFKFTGNAGIQLLNLGIYGGVVINEGGADSDFRIEGDNDQNMLFVDASTDKIGIKTATPDSALTVNGSVNLKSTVRLSGLPTGKQAYQIYSDANGTLYRADSTIGSGGGEANTASNIAGSGAGLFKQKTGVDLEFKRIKAGANITVTDSGDSIVIAASASSGMTNPMTTTGDIIYSSDGSGTPARLGVGTEGQVLKSNGSTPYWADESGGSGLTKGTTTIASSATRRILYDSAGVLSNNSLFLFNSSGELQLGSATDLGAAKLQVTGNMFIPQAEYIYLGNTSKYITSDAGSVYVNASSGVYLTTSGTSAAYAAGGKFAVGAYFGNPTAKIHIQAGTSAANNSPLKFSSGTNLTTPEAGAVEYNGTNLFFTPSSATRNSILMTASVNSVSPTSPNRTITVVIDGTTYYIHAKTTND